MDLVHGSIITFRCPECGEELAINTALMEVYLQHPREPHDYQPVDVCPYCGIMAGCEVIKEHLAIAHLEEQGSARW